MEAITIIISISASVIVTFILMLAICYGFKLNIEKRMDQMLSEEHTLIEKYVLTAIEQTKELIWDARINK